MRSTTTTISGAGRRIRRIAAAIAASGALLVTSACSGPAEDPVTIGLITKQQENPYWAALQEFAEEEAENQGATLVTASGESDVDVEGQEAAIREMTEEGVDGILIAPNDSTALNEAIADARDAGVIVIALDTPVNPIDAVDAYFATDNFRAGEIIGEYAAARAGELGLTPKIATLDLAPGIVSGEERHEGFLAGFGLEPGASEVVASIDTEGDRELGEAAMAEILAATPDVNVVYTVNEQAALGALVALKAADVDLGEVVLVSVDGGCEAIKSEVRGGDIDATAQQYPENMAREGVKAIVEAVRGGEAPEGYLDTGTQLITDDPAAEVRSRDSAYGVRNCWG